MFGKLSMILFVVTVLNANLFSSVSFDNPRVGIVISKASFEEKWEIVQMSAHGWAGVVNLAGIPYDCLFLGDLANTNLSRYSTLIFTQCKTLDNSRYGQFLGSLKTYLSSGGNLIIDGELARYDAPGEERNHQELDRLLGLTYRGYQGDSNFRIKVAENAHYVTRPFETKQFITQHLAGGLNILAFETDGRELLISTDEQTAHSYLSCRETGKNRTALVSEFGSWAGAASFFRNVRPQVFYANQLYNVLIRTVHWTIYGDVHTPFPVPQVANANVTAIIRHDGDGSDNPQAQITTMNYLTDFAKETGVVSLYTWVSSGATESGWETLAPLGRQMEDTGSEIGTHSKYHHIDDKMTPERWEEELSGSVKEIETNMAAQGYPIGKVDCFINPGNTIKMSDYQEIASRFSFYMTHGFEQDVPLGWGNLSWFTGPRKDFVVLENITAPDYQWFYDPEWSYTTAQATAYEEAVFDHLYHNIGRGAIFNEMWHDYSITTQPQRPKDRIVNDSHIAFYDALKAKFATHDIYCPTPHDLANKLRAMAQWDYQWKSGEDWVEIRLDLSSLQSDSIASFIGGMGLKMENTAGFIQSVTINGEPHVAFNDRVAILPNLSKGEHMIRVELGLQKPQTPRLCFVSKPMPAIRQTDEGLEVELLTKSKAKFAFYVPEPATVENADWQEWNRKGDRMLHGYVTSDRKIVLKKAAKAE